MAAVVSTEPVVAMATTQTSEDRISHAELTDLRAVQRTFDGAYARTALAQLSYAVVILRLFDTSFYWCGLTYTILALQLVFIAIYRYNLAVSNHDKWSDTHRLGTVAGPVSPAGTPGVQLPPGPDQPVIVRPVFRTAGTVVFVATLSTLCVEIALAVLILRV
ncbi:hypothetical protein FA10DRAFT_300277 [Acaromyces ingoldii]|uniref:DUF202 domain-containing protein n=1 Tax=Acaromyces ingoldii TaxID=215250 RepID=A0A316YRQ4_9BASI|nr:hypothetical protein FA10DRAFT_300277 [Acaromyces ingoldii]PWN91686.1 hypothetical protein FA10DRAFT_300277 [Acaromyces ingoldii]